MQENILLGFLMLGPMTGYEVKKAMGGSTRFFFNTSLGSIYPAFRRLEESGMVRLDQRLEKGRSKKIYSITPRGRRKFLAWLEKSPKLANVREESLLKMFFYEHADGPTRIRHTRDYIAAIEGRLSELLSLQDILKGVLDEDFRMSTLDFGIEFYRFQLNWYTKFLENLEKGGAHSGKPELSPRGPRQRGARKKSTEVKTNENIGY
ncbi:MAG: PadR family transcriptional regulator [Spirochaetota bacterium]|nr:PadR family transcriptional regulator [Spirochaetota bacterium]OPZ37444.1 MAG: Transcriptional regulator PadR-like family protein [Spirochaetes bacterium ADurb.BinA120]